MSFTDGISNLVSSLLSIVMGLVNSVLAIFQSILGLVQSILAGVLNVITAFVNLIWSNFGVIITVGLALCAYQIFVVDGRRPGAARVGGGRKKVA